MDELTDFDRLWDYSNPQQTEQKFCEILHRAREANDKSYLAQLLTQIARAQGLQGKYADAHSTLDEVEKMLKDDLKLARVRYLLERGRVFNSSGSPDKAMPFFADASRIASEEKFSRFAIDAVHMIAIVEPDPAKQIEWNLKGIAMADADPTQRGWLWALYNNLAESYALLKDYSAALETIRKLLAFQKEKGEPDMFTLKDEARFLRLLDHPEQSLAIIEPIQRKLSEEKKEDGWIEEELAESLYALGRADEAKPHFVKAYELLSKSDWCIQHEQAKLARLKQMSKLDGTH
jgi:tetratricopeptide (TPR) repeat protein